MLLTHAHSDHTGFAERARTEAGAPVWIHRADEQAARREETGEDRPALGKYLVRMRRYKTTISLSRRGGGG